MALTVCATHGHCFDGLASAALFSQFISVLKPDATFRYISFGYGPGAPGAASFDGEDNALLDYRYIRDPRLNYYFDHHKTAFIDDAHREDFESRRLTERGFYFDPTSQSCAKLIYEVAETEYQVSLAHLETLMTFADQVDGASFPSVDEATDLTRPRLRLVSVVERFCGAEFLGRAVPLLRQEGLDGLAEAPFIKKHYRRIAPGMREYSQRVKARGALRGHVAYIDLTEAPVTTVAKFCQYRHFPECQYSVMISAMAKGLKVAVGINPWNSSKVAARGAGVDLGSLCATYGGGGHAVVGAVSFAPKDRERASQVASEICIILQGTS